MRNEEYWKKRFEKLQESQMKKAEDYFDNLEREYKKASAGIQKEIEAWYQRFAVNNKISMAEAKRVLNTRELNEFRWSVHEYIRYGKENSLNQQWMKQLENASSRVHISRLESLQLQLQQHIEVLCGGQLDDIDRLLREIYEGGYQNVSSILQEMGINTSFSRLDTRKIDKVLTRPWTTDRNTFSDRIWNNKAKLINTVNTQLTQAFIRGSPSNKATQAIAKAMNVSRHQASRLVITESAFFASAACQDCYKDLGVERYEILATLDKRTCSDCGELEGKPIALKDYQVGSTAPPFHPYCRCTAIPYFADFTDGETRSAREEDGKSKYIKNQNYDSWKKKQEKKSQKSAILKEISLEPIEITEETIARVKPLSGTYMTSKQAQMLADREKELLRYVQNEPAGTEAVFGVDMNGNKLIQKIGGYGNVKTQPIDTPYILIHNHPTGYTFTLGDISAFAMDENMIALTVVGNNGASYLLEKETEFTFSSIYQKMQEAISKTPDYKESPEKYVEFMEDFLKGVNEYGLRYTKSR